MKKLFFLVTFLISFFSSSCDNDTALMELANELSKKFIITDGHIDLPYRLNGKYKDISGLFEGGDFDYLRAKKGGLDVPFMAIYVSASYQETGGAKEKADSLIDLVNEIATKDPDKFEIAYNVEDAERIFSQGKIALPMGIENGAAIEKDLSNLKHFYDRGIRYITLTHSKDNLICDSSYDTTRTWGGLSSFGKKVVGEMNRLGIMVDISHVTDEVINQIFDMTNVPVIASHSSCRKFTPGWERNMGDKEIIRLKENGGVIQINFGSAFLTQESQDKRNENNKKVEAYKNQYNLSEGDEKLLAFREKIYKRNPIYADVKDVVKHIDHVVNIAGIDHVGLGSDYDGVGDSLPYGLKDVSFYPNLIFHLLKSGYSEEEIEKICYKNVWRVWKAVEKTAARS